jgi:hypothetical protein
VRSPKRGALVAVSSLRQWHGGYPGARSSFPCAGSSCEGSC